MKLFSVTFDESDVVAIEDGVEIETVAGRMVADLGTDVGGATLAMIPLQIPVLDHEPDKEGFAEIGGRRRLLVASVRVDDDGKISFVRESAADARAFVVLAVIQRSPDARTELTPFGPGVLCVGNAFDRPIEKQVLVIEPGASLKFRRFSRGGRTGPWQTVAWDGQLLVASESASSESAS
jgi:hypothetical protein